MAIGKRSKKGKLNRVGRRRRNLRILMALVVIGLLGTLAYQLQKAGMVPANQPAAEWYETNRQPVELVSLPADDAAHDNYTEWWYYSGHLRTQDGRRFSFHYVIFVINRMAGHTVAHASFIDHDSGRHYMAQQRTAGKPSEDLADGFDFNFNNWRMAGSDGIDQVALDTPDFSLNLALENVNPPVLHGRTGLLDFKQAGTSYYYSRARMNVTGTAGLAGNSQLVSGEAWFDHQWGDFRVTALAWNWFAVQLDDGRDLMLFELFTPEGDNVARYGTLSGKGMADVILEEDDFIVDVNATWYSEQTRITYPMGWRVRVPGQAIDIALEAVIRNAEFDGRDTSYLIYWEGPVDVSGTHGGLGYIEMSGYQPGNTLVKVTSPATATTTAPSAGAAAADTGVATATRAPDSDRPGGAFVNARLSNVRAGPGTSFTVVATLKQYDIVRVIARRDGWLKIEVPGREIKPAAWIHGDLVAEP